MTQPPTPSAAEVGKLRRQVVVNEIRFSSVAMGLSDDSLADTIARYGHSYTHQPQRAPACSAKWRTTALAPAASSSAKA